MLGDIFDVLIDFEVKFQRDIYVRIFRNSFVNNTLTVFPVLSEQRRFLSVNRLLCVSASFCKTKTYDDATAGFKPAPTHRLPLYLCGMLPGRRLRLPVK
jgi:hypothetical protein